jgi:tetratricopeptide (TPR) repeat protein/predicted Ser/Thr protein kinase
VSKDRNLPPSAEHAAAVAKTLKVHAGTPEGGSAFASVADSETLSPKLSDTKEAIESTEPKVVVIGSSDSARLPRGYSIGRYTVLDFIGAGGMSFVYAAYDPNLDRRVAIKVLRVAGASSAPQRLWREAQMLAKLHHPNVTAVFEVGLVEDRVFVAMEYVAGRDLRQWLKATRPSWRKTLEIFVQAGRGLAAAHKQGIVHRDFKPANVMVGDDGTVRVADFGLACATQDSGRAEPQERAGTEPSPSSPSPLEQYETEHGTLVGTPAYMAPEQYLDTEVDRRTDTYGFCVAFFEALYGVRAFEGRTLAELRSAILAGAVTPRPKDTNVPGWLHALIMRGLSVDPADRFQTIDELMIRLERGVKPRYVAWLAAATVLGVAAVSAGMYLHMSGAKANACTSGAHLWTELWGPENQDAVHKTFARVGGDGIAAWSKVKGLLDRYVDSWSSAYRDSCEATQVRGVQSESLLDARMACLERRRNEVADFITLLGQGDPVALRNAVLAAHALTPVDQCSSESILSGPTRTAEDRKRSSEVYRLLSQAKAAYDVGVYAPALQVSEEAAKISNTLHDPSVLAEALLQLGLTQWKTGDFRAASATLVKAVAASDAPGCQHLRAEALVALLYVDGIEQQNFDNANSWKVLAEAPLQAIKDDALAGRLAEYYGNVLLREGDMNGAYDSAMKANALLARALPADHPDVARNLTSIGNALFFMGKNVDARRYIEKSLALLEDALGPNHPDVSEVRNNLANLLSEMGDNDEALALQERALAEWKRSLGPQHPYVAISLSNIGELMLKSERFDDAIARFNEALEIERHSKGDAHPEVAFAYDHLGCAYLAKRDYVAAIHEFHKAAQLLEASHNQNHPYYGLVLTNLGLAQLAAGSPSAAIPALESALAQRSTSKPHSVGPCRNSLCEISETRFALARALDALGTDRARAQQLAVEAHDAFEQAGGSWIDQADEVADWLKQHPAAQ